MAETSTASAQAAAAEAESHSAATQATPTTAAAAAPAAAAPAAAPRKDDEETFNPEEEVTEGNWTTPQVEVKEVAVETGEEDEEVFWKCRSKLYRWASQPGGGAGEWKERGVGEAKLLRHRQNRKIRFLLRQEKTLKIVANHYVLATDVYCRLSPNVGSEKIWVWTVMDFAENELKNEQFALKFGQVDQAQEFKRKFEEAAAENAKIFGVAQEQQGAAGKNAAATKEPAASQAEAAGAAAAAGVTKSNSSDSNSSGAAADAQAKPNSEAAKGQEQQQQQKATEESASEEGRAAAAAAKQQSS